MGINYNVDPMKKASIFLILSFLLCIQAADSAKAIEGLIKFSGKKDATIFLEVADTPEEKQKGLMNRPSLKKDRGMVFIFRPPSSVTFWMKDTLIPLDMIFIKEGTIVKIVKNTEPNQTHILYSSDEIITEVVEVNGGFADEFEIKAGDKITFENIAQIDYSKKSKLMIVEN